MNSQITASFSSLASKKLSSGSVSLLAAVALALFASNQSAQATARTWTNTGTDFNAAGDWTTTAPTAGDVGLFPASGTIAQPNLTASLSIAGILFSTTTVAGYDLTNSNSAVLTLTGYGSTGSSGTSNSSAAAIRAENTSLTNTVDAPLILAPFVAGNPSVFFQAAGGTLVVNGAISSAAGVDLSLKGAGTIQLNGNNSGLAASSIDQASEVVVLGNDNALGAGTFSVNNTSTIQAGTSARSISNAVIVDGTTTVAGSINFTFSSAGSVTVGPSSTSRTLTVTNSANTVLAGSVFLSGVAGTGRTLTVNGTGAVAISGVIANFNGAGTAGGLIYGGSNTLTLSNTNTYTGTTSVNGGTLALTGVNTTLGSGNVSVLATAITLSIATGVSNAISDSANLSLAGGGSAGIADNGYITLGSGISEKVGGLTLAGIAQAAGTYGSTLSAATNKNDEYFSGTGVINNLATVPEPATWVMLIGGVGILLGLQRFRRQGRA